MAISRLIGRWLGWVLLGGALLVALSGCTQRNEGNPFTPPYGSSIEESFG
ncbi:MAG TPA: hypothetical protein VHX44_07510 [Planctomycetota bacterium]|jgi:hypothetical protein|nr:hypothetical protein [Planctomycetota bacterium]